MLSPQVPACLSFTIVFSSMKNCYNITTIIIITIRFLLYIYIYIVAAIKYLNLLSKHTPPHPNFDPITSFFFFFAQNVIIFKEKFHLEYIPQIFFIDISFFREISFLRCDCKLRRKKPDWIFF